LALCVKCKDGGPVGPPSFLSAAPLSEARVRFFPPLPLRFCKGIVREAFLAAAFLFGVAVPGISVSLISGDFHCCGNAGIMGFKEEFHRNAVKMGSRLKATIKQMAPEQLLTDCLSCRMQFNQTLPYPVYHPIEILKTSYSAHEKN